MKILVWSFAVLGGASLLLGSCAMLIPPCCSQRASNERNASASLKTIASAQRDYRSNDRDENRVREFWRGDIAGLYSLLPPGSTEMIKLIELSVAGADAAPLGTSPLGAAGPGQVAQGQYTVPSPKAGYLYRALRHADEDPAALDPNRFAACAYPASAGSGKWTFIIDETGTIWRKPGGGPPDAFPDGETLKREWSKLD